MEQHVEIREANGSDIDAILAFDSIARHEQARARFIKNSVHDGTAHVAVRRNTPVGYAVLEHSFFGRGFVSMLYVHPQHRRQGIATALLRHLEQICQSPRLFVSTNESNAKMRDLLATAGYKQSGKVEDLDPGDPEIFYSKQLRNAVSVRCPRSASQHGCGTHD